jgi:hypothetical protein
VLLDKFSDVSKDRGVYMFKVKSTRILDTEDEGMVILRTRAVLAF